MKEVKNLHDGELLNVEKLKEILDDLPEEMLIADIYLGKIIEVTRVAVYKESQDSEDFLVIG